MSKDLTQYVTTKQAAELMGVHYSQIALLLREHRIKGIKMGHDWLVFAPSLEKYTATKSPKGRPPKNEPQLQSIE